MLDKNINKLNQCACSPLTIRLRSMTLNPPSQTGISLNARPSLFDVISAKHLTQLAIHLDIVIFLVINSYSSVCLFV
jgi:hypothetical protein